MCAKHPMGSRCCNRADLIEMHSEEFAEVEESSGRWNSWCRAPDEEACLGSLR
jgi:hypothetical protein